MFSNFVLKLNLGERMWEEEEKQRGGQYYGKREKRW